MVYNSEYSILSIAFQELSDEVHGYHFKGLSIWRGWDVVEWGLLSMCEVFVLLIGRASLDVFCYPFSHSCPPIGLVYCLEGGISPWMSCCWMVVISLEDVPFGVIFIYVDSVTGCWKS